jgi:hypothetical protein
MKAFDARCHACGRVHIIWVRSDHEEGETIEYAHAKGRKVCGEFGEHTLVTECSGLSNHEKWGDDLADA